jgi:hypothetical protein
LHSLIGLGDCDHTIWQQLQCLHLRHCDADDPDDDEDNTKKGDGNKSFWYQQLAAYLPLFESLQCLILQPGPHPSSDIPMLAELITAINHHYLTNHRRLTHIHVPWAWYELTMIRRSSTTSVAPTFTPVIAVAAVSKTASSLPSSSNTNVWLRLHLGISLYWYMTPTKGRRTTQGHNSHSCSLAHVHLR